MARVLYTAQATVTGGRGDGHGWTSDGSLEVDFRAPRELGGEGGGVNPEQLFALGYADCFGNAVARVAQREGAEPGTPEIIARVMLLPTEERGFKLGVELDVTLPGVEDSAEAARLVGLAHRVCPYSNAVRGNVEVTLTANGQPVG